MSRDYAELERAFIGGLAEDTGRDLSQWMALIDGQEFAHRNDMIDWLRQQGLTFAKASRLERIHHNGGKPLYGGERALLQAKADDPAQPPSAPPRQPLPSEPADSAAPPVEPPAAPPPPQRSSPIATGTGDLSAFLARAKGYRPLAELLMRAIREAVPALVVDVHDTHADLAAPAVFGAVVVTAKDVRLSLDLGDHPFDGGFRRLRLAGATAGCTHTLVIDDARRIDPALRELIRTAADRINS